MLGSNVMTIEEGDGETFWLLKFIVAIVECYTVLVFHF